MDWREGIKKGEEEPALTNEKNRSRANSCHTKSYEGRSESFAIQYGRLNVDKY